MMVPNPQGIDSVFTIMKGTFVLGDTMELAEEQLPLVEADQYHDEPGQSSLKEACDLVPMKPGTDVLLSGSAIAPNGGTTCEMEVSLRVGNIDKHVIDKRVRVLGDRVLKPGVVGRRMSDPEPFQKMPLVWERAFGGADQTKEDNPQLHAELRNPVGTGFCLGNGQLKLDELRLPNLERPDEPISSWKDRPSPAGLAAICPQWEPRRSYAGTYDDKWQQQRAPYLPHDFDPRFFQSAPEDQVVPGYLQGNEKVEVTGVTKQGVLKFRLPSIRPQVTYRIDGREETPPVNLDTVLIEPDESRLVLCWRTALACDKKTLRVREVEVELVQSA